MSVGSLQVTDAGVDLQPDVDRAVVRWFVPGREDVGPGESRARQVIDRILELDETDVVAAMEETIDRLGERAGELAATFDAHAASMSSRLDPGVQLSPARWQMLGAAFTHEYTIEGAALCNPSVVAHPEARDDGATGIVLSVRGIGEGHRSTIGFRTGSVTATGSVRLDPPGPRPRTGDPAAGVHHRSVLHRLLVDAAADEDNVAFVLNGLPETFDDVDLQGRIDALREDTATRRDPSATIALLDHAAKNAYRTGFATPSRLSERVLWPHAPAESHGMEDARFVEITDGSAPRYCATYTAFDGVHATQHLLTTEDFVAFDVAPMAGAAARGKGLALFPRQIGGRYVALSRADRETNAVARSDDLRCWDESRPIASASRHWEVVQLGNCGSPIETSEGWLVLTHGVGPLRTYSIGAILLDLDDPDRLLARTARPIVAPRPGRLGGYVPNVVYSCGALAVGDLLVLPYGVGDRSISVATLSIAELLGSMERCSAPAS